MVFRIFLDKNYVSVANSVCFLGLSRNRFFQTSKGVEYGEFPHA
jgi:hypothetical protein